MPMLMQIEYPENLPDVLKVALTPDIRSELDIRLAEHELHPDDVSSWDEVRSRLWRSL